MPNWLSALQEACELRHAHAARLHCAQITEASRGIDAAQLGRLSELVAGLIRQEAWADALQMSDALEQEYTRVFRQLMILHHEP